MSEPAYNTDAPDGLSNSRFQQVTLGLRGNVDVVIDAGGRGGGKTDALCKAVLAHCSEWGAAARPLVVRESHGGLLELQSKLYELCLMTTEGRASRNKADNTITLPTGGVVTFTNVGDEESYVRHQGKTYTGLFGDEVGAYSPAAFAFLDRLRSNLRVPPGRKPEIRFTANPHGRAHTVLCKRWINRAPPWRPFNDDNGDSVIWTHSTYRDNPFIDADQYERQLRASAGGDKALADAWLSGDWSVLGGVMFDNFDPAVHVIAPPTTYGDWKFRCGADWGAAAPAVGLLLGLTPLGDIVLLDETDTAVDENDLSVGSGAVVQTFAEMLQEMFQRWGRKAVDTVCDDARGLQGDTVIEMLRHNQIPAHKPFRKDRVGGWNLIRQLLEGAKLRNGPGLYITTNCRHLIATLPEAPRGTHRPEDVDPRWACDHWIDALVYGARDLYPIYRITQGKTIGMY